MTPVKRYRGAVRGGTAGEHLVVVETPDGPMRPLEHHRHHSPSGFSWGYAGSGPAELARSLLWDYLGAEPHPACYQAFKFEYVAGWPQDGPWRLDGADVGDWLDGYRATGRPVLVTDE